MRSPDHGLPGATAAIFSGGISVTVVHHSTSPMKTRFNWGSYAGPFHSAPPAEPGQKWTGLPTTNGASSFSIRVTGSL